MKNKLFAVLCLGACIFSGLSCIHESAPKVSSVVQSGTSPYHQSNDNTLLSGTWVIEGLDIPNCKLCKESNWRLNKMWNYDLEVKDTFRFIHDSMFYNSVNGQRMAERFRFNDSLLLLVGFDWNYIMEVRKFTSSTLNLAITQSYPSEINSTEGAKYLIVKMVKSN